eukprot:CAMPEP_0184515932 /NCGR_PEP_ID=MMETSP0198_2-20121128/4758_1 /TAXON_ID=1112570 /ORGANISM="Thraustochytrium sp., Strain LLF1b" /LENGTH=256 /DNA_ID=CAMNT_0026906217 /DNA_START=2146 /DNA_END=2914 /DNA_ORIENTATION=-
MDFAEFEHDPFGALHNWNDAGDMNDEEAELLSASVHRALAETSVEKSSAPQGHKWHQTDEPGPSIQQLFDDPNPASAIGFSPLDVAPHHRDQVGMGAPTPRVEGLFDAPSDLDGYETNNIYSSLANTRQDLTLLGPGSKSKVDREILDAFEAVLPTNGPSLSGVQKELMPVFSGSTQVLHDSRPILQSRGHGSGTVYIGGATELPDHLRIDPREAYRGHYNIPGDLVQSGGELLQALDILDDGIQQRAEGYTVASN